MGIHERDWYRESFNKPKKVGFWYSSKKILIVFIIIVFFVFLLGLLIDYLFPVRPGLPTQHQIPAPSVSVIPAAPYIPKQNIPLPPSPAPAPSPAPDRSKVLYSSSKSQTIQYTVRGGVKYIDVEINGIPVEVMIDTGASFVSLNSDTINKLGIRSFSGQVMAYTAGGVVPAYTFKCSSVKVGNMEVKDIDCSYLPTNSHNLLGNSFLSHFSYSFNARNNTITLTCLDCVLDDSVSGIVELSGKRYLLYKSGRLEEIK